MKLEKTNHIETHPSSELTKLDYDALFFNSSEGIIITNKNREIVKVNPTFTRITGYEEKEVIGKTPSFLKSHRHDKKFFEKLEEALIHEEKWQGEIWNRLKDGEIHRQLLTIIPIKVKGEIDHYIGIFNDITDILTTNKDLRYVAYYDSLTGLPNRMLLYDRLSFMINLAKRKRALLAVLLLDLNRFKLINDTLGYSYGDQLLQSVAIRLKSCTREVDSVFRLGDDEFAVLLEDISQPQDAARVAKRILSTCSQPYFVGDRELFLTISIGVSIYPADGEQFETLLRNAETAMVRAKELGINNYQHYEPSMNTQSFEQLTIEYNLQKALKNNQFQVFYQPIINIATKQITGAEALIRWNHPELGMIPPIKFIPLAEDTGLIIPIGEWVLETACRDMYKWQKQFDYPYIVSVNLSARQFQQRNLVTIVEKTLLESGLKNSSLKLEITESIGMKNPEETIKILTEFKARGILIAIDDFGTGYSSLNYLKRFPIDTIKIDRSFLLGMCNNTQDAALIDAIIAMAHTLGLNVVAEGVETPDQLNYLAEKGCEEAQGFYFSKPVNGEEFEKLLKNNPWISQK
ncbi:MAG: EAL domain-containing protein [Chitinispirillaceae bacterium]|nr:EAL domain-containing protein [Chitinispirillaceae bacterium]